MALKLLCQLCAVAGLLPTTIAHPGVKRQAPTTTQAYRRPYPTDSRGPCPMLNTLANHGYINHSGRNIRRQDLITALLVQVGIAESTVDTALTNAFTLCKFVTGQDCGTTLTNLTLLGLPHAFEHDHSFSREDYNMAYQPSIQVHSDNNDFNATIFQQSIDVLGGADHVNFQQMNQIRLQRESLSMQQAYPGWFLEAKPTTEFEAGFIFSVMSDFNLSDYSTNPQIYVPWWQFWFTNEALPYELGWHPPNPPKDVNFVLSVSSAILAASVTSTPSPLPSDAIGPANRPMALPAEVDTMTYPLVTNAPYVGPYATNHHKRDDATSTDAPATTLGPATTMTAKNPYVDTLLMEDIIRQQDVAGARMSTASSN
jgi:hypothetical protein